MINKKKILYCITKANWGGAQKYVYDLVTALDPLLFDIAIIVGGEGLLATRLIEEGFRVIILDDLVKEISLWKDIKSFFKLLKIFKKEKPDIVHLNSSKMGLLGTLAGRFTRVRKIIFTGHGWAFNEERSKWQKRIIFLLHKFTIALAHKTIAVSEQTKRQIVGGKFLNNKMEVIKNGVGEIDFFDREKAKEKISEKLPRDLDWQNKIWLGTISELHKNKGLKYLIEAMHLLNLDLEDKSKLPIVIIIGEGERKEKLQARINRYGLQDTIFLVGRINEAHKYLKAFDIFSLTSITEALPYVLLEAGQAGLPVLASEVGGIPEIIENKKTGLLVPPKEPEEIKKAIEFLLDNKDRAEIFGQNLKQKIQEHFNKDTMIRKTREIYG